MLAIGEVSQVPDAVQLLGHHEVLNLLDDALRPNAVRQSGDHDALEARRDLFDASRRAHSERTFASCVRILDALEANDLPTVWQVWSRDQFHEVIEAAAGLT